MIARILLRIGLLLAPMLALQGCTTAGPMHKDANRVSLQCPQGHTMQCEANRIGRIRHGSFGKDNDRCACVPDNGRMIESPKIPAIHR